MLCALNPEDLIPRHHPIRSIKQVIDAALSDIDLQLEAMYSERGRPSIPPERLLKAMLLMALFSVRSDRQLCEQVRYNLMFRWFLDMNMTDAVWDRTVFSHNRERLIEHEIARELFGSVVEQARQRDLLSEEHFSVDGTLIEAWASMKSFRPKEEKDDDSPSSGSKSNRWGRLSWVEAYQRDPRVEDRPGVEADAQGFRKRGQTLILRPCPDGEPQRSGGRCGEWRKRTALRNAMSPSRCWLTLASRASR